MIKLFLDDRVNLRMLSHTTAPDGSRIYPEAQRVAVDDGIDTAGSTHTSRK